MTNLVLAAVFSVGCMFFLIVGWVAGNINGETTMMISARKAGVGRIKANGQHGKQAFEWIAKETPGDKS